MESDLKVNGRILQSETPNNPKSTIIDATGSVNPVICEFAARAAMDKGRDLYSREYSSNRIIKSERDRKEESFGIIADILIPDEDMQPSTNKEANKLHTPWRDMPVYQNEAAEEAKKTA